MVSLGWSYWPGAYFCSCAPGSNLHRDEAHCHHPDVSRHIVTAEGETYDYNFNPLVGIAISFAVGYLSSFLGIGGGIIHVPALIYFLDFPVHIATATSHFILAIMALTGTVVHIFTGNFPLGGQANAGAVHWGLVGSACGRLPLLPHSWLLNRPKPGAGPGFGRPPHFLDVYQRRLSGRAA